MFGKKKANKSNIYFDSFPKLAHYAVECGERILDFMEHFDHEKLLEIKEGVHAIEHKADETKHEITQKLLTEFMTPIDREDIFELLRLIDNVTDAMEEVSLKLYLYDYRELPPDSIPFTELTVECIRKTEICLGHFNDYLKPDVMTPLISEVIHLEEKSDAEYIEDMHNLYLNETDGFKRHRAEALYTMLEEVSDACREVCRYVQNIAFKNI